MTNEKQSSGNGNENESLIVKKLKGKITTTLSKIRFAKNTIIVHESKNIRQSSIHVNIEGCEFEIKMNLLNKRNPKLVVYNSRDIQSTTLRVVGYDIINNDNYSNTEFSKTGDY